MKNKKLVIYEPYYIADRIVADKMISEKKYYLIKWLNLKIEDHPDNWIIEEEANVTKRLNKLF